MEGIENRREGVGRGVSKAQEIREEGGKVPKSAKIVVLKMVCFHSMLTKILSETN